MYLLVPLHVKVPHDYLLAQRFTRRTHRTQKSCYIDSYGLLQQKDTDQNEQTEKVHEQSPGETRTLVSGARFQVSSASRVACMCLIALATMCDNTCKVMSTRKVH